MSLKIVVICSLALLLLDYTLGAPHNSRKEQDLKKSFIEFLQQDKELSALLGKADFGGSPTLSRNVRQAEEDDMTGDEQDVSDEPPKKDGFFDRAAKFVMEVLQRFLKWINTDD